MLQEPEISINGTLLSNAQAMTVRCAINSFISALKSEGLGKDQLGIDIAKGFIDRAAEVILLMSKELD